MIFVLIYFSKYLHNFVFQASGAVSQARGRGRRGRGGRGRGRGPAAAAVRRDDGWDRIRDENDHVAPHDFTVRVSGPRQLPARNSAPIEYFLLLFTVATMRTVLQNTRAYAEKIRRDMADWIDQHPSSRWRRWSMDDITLGNLKKFLGLCLNSGLLRKKNMKAYWSRKSPSQYTPFFATVMPYRMFALFQRVLHVGRSTPQLEDNRHSTLGTKCGLSSTQ